MSLSDLASLGSFISGIAVLATLIFLTLQVRQAERYQRAIVQQGRAARLSDFQLSLADPAIADVIEKGQNGDDDLTLTQLRQWRRLFLTLLINGEDTFLQHKAGLISDDVFDGFCTILRTNSARAGWRIMWSQLRATRETKFREFVDQMIAETPLATAVDELADWKAAVAAGRNRAAN